MLAWLYSTSEVKFQSGYYVAFFPLLYVALETVLNVNDAINKHWRSLEIYWLLKQEKRNVHSS